MGISITTDEHQAIPRTVVMTLVCDNGRCQDGLTSYADDYVTGMHTAKREGWSESNTSGKRLFFCPACSGKRL